jgi:tetratricopeptide (TPR) repeat protein
MNLWNYGELLLDRGDLPEPRSLLRAKKILDKTPFRRARNRHDFYLLGRSAEQSGDRESATSFYQRQVTILEKVTEAAGAAGRLADLARLALLQGQGEQAERLWRNVLALNDESTPGGPVNAEGLTGLAEALKLRGRSAEAELHLRLALEVWRAINPEAVATGSIQLKLGLLLLARGDAVAAEPYLRAAIRIHERLGGLLPESYHALARLQAQTGKTEEAAATYALALDARVPEERPAARENPNGSIAPRSAISTWRPPASSSRSKRPRRPEPVESRARDLRQQLAQRDLRFPAELLRALRRPSPVGEEYDQTQAELAAWRPEQGGGRWRPCKGANGPAAGDVGDPAPNRLRHAPGRSPRAACASRRLDRPLGS